MRPAVRRSLAGLVLLAALWPAAGRAEEPPPTTVAATPEAAEPEGGPRTLEVTPHTALVHDQSVLLRGRGWPPHQTGMGAAQCVTGITDTRGCGPVRFYAVDAAGNFRGRYRVSVILETSIGTFDCRVEQCVLGANHTPVADGARFVNLTFDPAGPDPVRRTGVTIDPDTALVDGQEVAVTGDGFEVVEPGFGGSAQLDQCVLPAFDVQADCDPATGRGGPVDVQGHLDATVQLEAILHLDGGATHDCRTGGCVLLVRDFFEPAAEGALVPLDYDPSGALRPPPTLVVDPAVDLVDGDLVHVTGTGWPAGDDVYFSLCRTGATAFSDCARPAVDGAHVDAQGELDTEVGVRSRLRLGLRDDGDELDCRVDACSLVATSGDGFRRSADAPLAFAPDGGVVDIAVRVTPSAGLRSGQRVTVEGEGYPDTTMTAIQCLASAETIYQCDFDTWVGIGHGSGDDFFSPRRDPTSAPFSGRFVVVEKLILGNGRRVDCSLTPCAVVVADDPDFDVTGRAAIDFAPDPATVGPVTATPTFTG